MGARYGAELRKHLDAEQIRTMYSADYSRFSQITNDHDVEEQEELDEEGRDADAFASLALLSGLAHSSAEDAKRDDLRKSLPKLSTTARRTPKMLYSTGGARA